MSMTFREAVSTTRDVRIIEVWWGNLLIATINPIQAGPVVGINVNDGDTCG